MVRKLFVERDENTFVDRQRADATATAAAAASASGDYDAMLRAFQTSLKL